MNDYDFSRLNDKEFEVLCTDLIGADLGARFERFKPGRDGGVDGRYFSPEGGQWILQAKHWPGTPFSKLVSHLRSSEASKVAALNPERYVLAVSHSLSPSAKEELIEVLGASCPVSVYGKQDLNDLLAFNSAIERRHFKLWLSSSNVLMGLLNNAIDGRSDALMRSIVDKSKVFAQTRNFDWAQEKLNQLGTVIITGQPGIGKTTLAEQLILFYAGCGYELVCISDYIHEAEQVYIPEKRQLFYFDDFLGDNYLESLSGRQGSHIARFIQRIHRDRDCKKFVLTSRSTILNQGKILNQAFEHHNIDRNEMEIRLEALTDLDKANILYNHIWHSGLPPENIESLHSMRRYREIITHPNFNPRIIQFITDPQRLTSVPKDDYWHHVRWLLHYPSKVWEHPFDVQLDDFGRLLVLLVTLHGRSISEHDLGQAYARAIAMPTHANLKGRRELKVALRHLTNSMLNRVISSGKVFYELFNPSLGDFIFQRYSTEPAVLETIFASLRNCAGLQVASDMKYNNLISDQTFEKIHTMLLEREEAVNFYESDPEYLATICLFTYSRACRIIPNGEIPLASPTDAIWSSTFSKRRLETVTLHIITQAAPKYYYYATGIVSESIALGVIRPTEAENFALSLLAAESDVDSIESLAKLIEQLERAGIESVIQKFAELTVAHLTIFLFDHIEESSVFNNGYDIEAAQKNLQSEIRQQLQAWSVEPTQPMIDTIIHAYELEVRMLEFLASKDDYFTYVTPYEADQTMEIDDLFSKSQ